MTKSLTIDCGEDMLSALGMTHGEFSKEAKTLIAVKLLEMGRLSAGQRLSWRIFPSSCFLSNWRTAASIRLKCRKMSSVKM